ncbi:MAG: hypothetical protein KA444_00150 [Bacteroidia bacterium]|nr:hypothetical protein [Bacteroidia bacterium]
MQLTGLRRYSTIVLLILLQIFCLSVVIAQKTSEGSQSEILNAFRSIDYGAKEEECVICERVALFNECKQLIENRIWPGLNDSAFKTPLIYFTNEFTYVAFSKHEIFNGDSCEILFCPNGLRICKIARLDSQAFHMENKMNFIDSSSIYFFNPMMQCSDVETMNIFVPDFEKTEDWLQLVMHEYFHNFQFLHRPALDYLSTTIKIAADTLDQLYLKYDWFKAELEKENEVLLSAINCESEDSIRTLVQTFVNLRENRREKFKKVSDLNLSQLENFWETIEGSARYSEYYMAGKFSTLSKPNTGNCDKLFHNFSDYTDSILFETKPEFKKRTEIMQAYYYVIGFNLCRLLDKLNVNYKHGLFNEPDIGLYHLLRIHLKM